MTYVIFEVPGERIEPSSQSTIVFAWKIRVAVIRGNLVRGSLPPTVS